MIVGKIILAIVTTAAMIAGLVGVEHYKLFIHDNVDQFRNVFVNLALPLFLLRKPSPPIRTKSIACDPILYLLVCAYPEGFSIWDKMTVNGPCTLEEFLNRLEVDHKLKVLWFHVEKVPSTVDIGLKASKLKGHLRFHKTFIKI